MIAAANPRASSRRLPARDVANVGGLIAKRLASLDAPERPPHWSETPGSYHVRVADVSDETTRQIGKAGTTWGAIHRALRRQERKGRTAAIRDAARVCGILSDHGIRGLARDTGLHPQTVRAHLDRLVGIGLIELVPVRVGGRQEAVVIRLTVADRHRRPPKKTGRMVGGKSTHELVETWVENPPTSRESFSICLTGKDRTEGAIVDTSISGPDPWDLVPDPDTTDAGLTAGEAGRHAAAGAGLEQGCESAVLTVNTTASTGSGTGGPEPEPEPAAGDPPAPVMPAAASDPTPRSAVGGWTGKAWRDPRQLPGEPTAAFLRGIRGVVAPTPSPATPADEQPLQALQGPDPWDLPPASGTTQPVDPGDQEIAIMEQAVAASRERQRGRPADPFLEEQIAGIEELIAEAKAKKQAEDDEVHRLEELVAKRRSTQRADDSAHYRERWVAERDPTNVGGRRDRMMAQVAEAIAADRPHVSGGGGG